MMLVKNNTAGEIFLIPFYFFSHESQFKEYNEDTVRLDMLFDLVRDNLLTIKDAASQAKLTEETFREKMLERGR